MYDILSRRALPNSQFRGGLDPHGTPIKANGYPDYSGSLYPGPEPNTVVIPYSGSRNTDFARANAAAGLPSTPQDYTWHHVEDWDPLTNLGTMQLVESAVHDSTRHSGGVAKYKAVRGGYP
jgi:hypothetical protein